MQGRHSRNMPSPRSRRAQTPLWATSPLHNTFPTYTHTRLCTRTPDQHNKQTVPCPLPFVVVFFLLYPLSQWKGISTFQEATARDLLSSEAINTVQLHWASSLHSKGFLAKRHKTGAAETHTITSFCPNKKRCWWNRLQVLSSSDKLSELETA